MVPTITGILVQQVNHMAVMAEHFKRDHHKRAWACYMIHISILLRRIEIQIQKK
jgi:hypothetical protein